MKEYMDRLRDGWKEGQGLGGEGTGSTGCRGGCGVWEGLPGRRGVSNIGRGDGRWDGRMNSCVQGACLVEGEHSDKPCAGKESFR